MHRLLLAALLAAVVLHPGRPTAVDTPCGKVVLSAVPAAPLPGAAPTGYVLVLQPPPGARVEASVESPPGAPPTPFVQRNGLLESPYPLPYGSDAVLIVKCGSRASRIRVRLSAPPEPGPGGGPAAPKTLTPPEPVGDYPFGVTEAYRKVFGNHTAGHGGGGSQETAASLSAATITSSSEGCQEYACMRYRVTPLRIAAAVLLVASLVELLLSQREHGRIYEA